MIISPNVRFDDKTVVDKSTISKAQSAYTFFANQMELGGIYNSQKRVILNGYLILIYIQKDFNYGFITGNVLISYTPIIEEKDDKCELYLESGYYDLIGTGRCTEAVFMQPILNYTSNETSYVFSIDEPLQGLVKLENDTLAGEQLPDGFLTESLWCTEPSSTILDPCSNTYDTGLYCPNLQKLKDAQQVMPSSMYSGKLRLFIQAIYGSTRTDYERVGFQLNIGSLDNESYPVIGMPRGFTNSGWIFTSSEYEYFYCVQSGTSVTFKPMDLSECAKEFRDILIANPDWEFEQKKRMEAYILAYANISEKDKFTLPINGPTILGSPLDYGWHSNWKGDEVSCVTFYDDPVATQYLSTQQQLNINEIVDSETGDITFSVVNAPVSIDQPWWPWTNGLNIFYYDESEQSMIPVEYPAIIFGGYTGTFDSPIYSYYKLDEVTGDSELIVCIIHMDIQAQVNDIFNLPNGTRFDSPQRFLVSTYKTYTDGGGIKGFSINGVSTDINIESTDNDRIYEQYPVSGPQHRSWPFDRNAGYDSLLYPTSNLWAAANGLTPGDTKDIYDPITDSTFTCQWEWRGKWLFMGYEQLNNFDDQGISGSLFFEVILGDCSSVVTGNNSNEFADGSTNHIVRETLQNVNGVFYPFGGELVWYISSSFYSYRILEVIVGAPPDDAMVYNAHASWVNTTLVTNTFSDPFSDRNNTELDIYPQGSIENVITIAEAGDPEYFSPTISDKPTHTIDTGRRSTFNKYKIDHSAFNKDGGFINDSSVGWS